MERVSTCPDDYLATLPDEIRGDMTALDGRLAAALPGHRRSLWQGVFWGGSAQSIIGYGHYSYVRSDKTPVEWFVVGLARQKNYYSVYENDDNVRHHRSRWAIALLLAGRDHGDGTDRHPARQPVLRLRRAGAPARGAARPCLNTPRPKYARRDLQNHVLYEHGRHK